MEPTRAVSGALVSGKGVEMPGEQLSEQSDDRAMAGLPRSRTSRQMDLAHSSEDCHELVLRLKAQAQCLEEILSGIRTQIDELECDEALFQIREKLEEEI